MGLSHLQGSPWHIVQIKRKVDEDNDPFFTRKKRNSNAVSPRKKVESYVQLKIGNTYLVTDPSSGINNQKVIFEESADRVNAKVKLGDKIFIVKKSGLSNVDSEEQTVNDSNISTQHQYVKHSCNKTKKEANSHRDPLLDNIVDKTSLSQKQNLLVQSSKVQVYLNSSFDKYDAFIEKEIYNGFLIRLVNKKTGIIKIKFFSTNAVSFDKNTKKTEPQSQKKTPVIFIRKHESIIPKKIEKHVAPLPKQKKKKTEAQDENSLSKQLKKEVTKLYPIDINKYKFGSVARFLCVVRHEVTDFIQPIAYVNLKILKPIFSDIKFSEIKTEELFPISSGADSVKQHKYALFDFEVSKKSGNSKNRYSLNYHEDALISANRQVPIYRIRLFDTDNIHDLISASFKFLLSKKNDESGVGFIALSKNCPHGEVNSIYMPANGIVDSQKEISCFSVLEKDLIKIIVDGEEILFYQKTSRPAVKNTTNFFLKIGN